MRFIPGPIFSNVLLADEINRAPPRTQSALLEAMSDGGFEGTVLGTLIMPYCWDGHDNALRAEQTGTGLSLARDNWSPKMLQETVIELLRDTEMRKRMATISKDMTKSNGQLVAALSILAKLKISGAE